jgi:hypothetical protein
MHSAVTGTSHQPKNALRIQEKKKERSHAKHKATISGQEKY